MSARLLVDTDVLIDHLRGVPAASAFLEGCEETLVLSAVTVAELFAGVRDGDERRALDSFLAAFEIAAVDAAIAERGGLIRREYGRSHGTGLADALIAATAETIAARLVTLNRKHFPMVHEVVVPYRK